MFSLLYLFTGISLQKQGIVYFTAQTFGTAFFYENIGQDYYVKKGRHSRPFEKVSNFFSSNCFNP